MLPAFRARIERKCHIPPGSVSLSVNGSEFPELPVTLGEILKDGDIVAFTTDTAALPAMRVFGMGAIAMAASAASVRGDVAVDTHIRGESKLPWFVSSSLPVRGVKLAKDAVAREELGELASTKENPGIEEAESVAYKDTNRSVIDRTNKDNPEEEALRSFPRTWRRGRQSAFNNRSSSEHGHFHYHVAFDNIQLPRGDTPRQDTRSLTLNVRHKDHRVSEQSRTFMVGLSGPRDSGSAVQWLLQSLAEDGDEVVCVSMLEKDENHWQDADYRREAKDILEDIVETTHGNYAVSIVLEYAIGNLHDTFQQLVSRNSLSLV